MLFCDGQAIGVRTDYNGVLLLDSILQKTLIDPKEKVKFELLLSEVKKILICDIVSKKVILGCHIETKFNPSNIQQYRMGVE